MDTVDPDIAANAGAIKALEYGLRALIISHPDPEKLKRNWQSLLLLIADAHSSSRTVLSVPTFHQGLREGLEKLTSTIERSGRPR